MEKKIVTNRTDSFAETCAAIISGVSGRTCEEAFCIIETGELEAGIPVCGYGSINLLAGVGYIYIAVRISLRVVLGE